MAHVDGITHAFMLLASAAVFGALALATLRIGPVWDAFARRRMGELADRIERLALPQDQVRWMLRWWGVSLAAVVVLTGVVFRMPPVALTLTGLMYVAPQYALDFLIRRRSKLLRHQMVGASQGLGNCVRAGLSLAQGIETVAAEIPEPLAAEFRRIVYEYQRGRPLKEALEAVRRRLDLEPFNLFALALEVSIEQGGRLNEALTRISASLQENERLERKLEADTAGGRQVVKLLAIFPVAFLAFFYYVDPTAVGRLFTTFAGQLVLAGMIVLVYVGVRWAARILQIDP